MASKVNSAVSKTPQSQLQALQLEEHALSESLGRLSQLGKGDATVTYTITGVSEQLQLNRQSIGAAIKNRLSQIEQAKGLLQSAINRSLPGTKR